VTYLRKVIAGALSGVDRNVTVSGRLAASLQNRATSMRLAVAVFSLSLHVLGPGYGESRMDT
jgi:hypothetical protein